MSDRSFISEFNKSYHRMLWSWLSLNPGKYKDEWPGWNYMPRWLRPGSLCFACAEASYKEPFGSNYCESCPLEWDIEDSECNIPCRNGEFGKWEDLMEEYRYFRCNLSQVMDDDRQKLIERRMNALLKEISSIASIIASKDWKLEF